MDAQQLANEIIEGATACGMDLTEYLLANFSYRELGEIERNIKLSLSDSRTKRVKMVRRDNQ